ncbi:MAG: A/G-specific adenine glycosylase [Clostridiales bacterium]|nr:A/G-specific adenine glycosylase [Clostridiales bacterium]
MIIWLLWDPSEGELRVKNAEQSFILLPIHTSLADCLVQTAGFSSDAALLLTDNRVLATEAETFDIPTVSLAQTEDLLPILVEDARHMNSQWSYSLVQWYLANHRDLPWRRTKSPYAVWVSEIMLQQTRVEAVIGYYTRFMGRFPTVKTLADADIDEVLKYWEGLGYYSRARNLHKAAKCIMEQYQGTFPSAIKELEGLPGIGAYTAGAIASIAFDVPAAAVDGNVLRVLSRLYALWDDIMTDYTRRRVTALIEANIPLQAPGDFTQSLMELGALVCIPGRPRCEVCPLSFECKAHMLHVEEQLPVRIPKTKVREQKRAVFLFFNEDRVLLHRRPEGTVLGGLYEFPGVDLVNGAASTVDQAFFDAYGIQPKGTVECGEAVHRFTHIHWHMTICTSDLVPEQVPEDGSWLWADAATLDQIMIPTAFKSAMKLVKQRFSCI